MEEVEETDETTDTRGAIETDDENADADNEDEEIPEDLDDIDYASEQNKELQLEEEKAKKAVPVSTPPILKLIGAPNDPAQSKGISEFLIG